MALQRTNAQYAHYHVLHSSVNGHLGTIIFWILLFSLVPKCYFLEVIVSIHCTDDGKLAIISAVYGDWINVILGCICTIHQQFWM